MAYDQRGFHTLINSSLALIHMLKINVIFVIATSIYVSAYMEAIFVTPNYNLLCFKMKEQKIRNTY